MAKISFKNLINKHSGRSFLLCCPGKNFLEHKKAIIRFVQKKELITIGSNKISELINLDYHIFTNNDKYEAYGHMVSSSSALFLGSHILNCHVKKHKPKNYVSIKYTDKDKTERMSYDRKKDTILGYYRTSGNLSIMLCHLMGASIVYIAGMSGFTYKFDGTVHYYKAEINRDKKTKREWRNRYDKPVAKSLDDLKDYGINFKIITPTIFKKHYDTNCLGL